MDLILLLVPAVAVDVYRNRNYRATAAGFLPLVLWLFFSLVYYGFLFPNSAYAKLSTGLGRVVYLGQGMRYMFDAFYRDTLTLVSILSVAMAGLFLKSAEKRAVAAGLLLYLLYVVWVGGDFMRGRFLTVPLVGAVGLLLETDLFTKRRLRFAVLPVVVALGFQNPVPNILAGKSSYNRVNKTMYHGITDERLYYLENVSLFFGKPLSQQAGHDMSALRERQSIEVTRVKYTFTAGIAGLNAGPGTYLIDQWALGDALLARLPMLENRWRIGHFPRVAPAGYVLSLVTGENHVRDEKIHQYYDHLRRITRGPVFNLRRLKTIVAMNLGRYDSLVRGHNSYLPIDKREYAEIVDADLNACGPR
ncbi:MAG: hypothetical protein KAT30_01335, partial [Candidatus Krumholzibacteria bacterium]|nr:hypothetical protein [Candidatus Krumholzibacteria bacterium]